MIRKLVRQMLTAQILSALTVSVCLLIDNVMIARFLGVQAMAAYELANPMLLAIGAVGSLLSAGIQVACSRSMGKGLQEETNASYSSSIVLVLMVSVPFMLLMLLFRNPLAAALGAGQEGELFLLTRDYLAGFGIGAPASMGALVLVPFLQMAGQSGLLIAAVLGMTVADIALDLLNVLVLHGGMFGMGLASSLSYYIAMMIAACYFLSRRCVFRFSRRLVTRRKIAELFKGGIPAGFNMASCVLLVFFLNRLIKHAGGSDAVAAYAVITAIGNSANCITTGIGGVSLTLSGIFYNEEDRRALRELLKLLVRGSVVLGLAMGVLLLVFSPLLVSVFITAAGPARDMAILGLRFFAAGLIPCCVNNAVKNAYQATGRVRLTELISLLECAVFPALAGYAGSLLMGVNGVWLYFALGETLMLLTIGLCVRLHTRRAPWRDGACLLLRDSFGAAPEDLLETDITSMQEVADAAERAERFCAERGQSSRISSHIGLCIEEMAGNIVQHGFTLDQTQHHLSVRMLRKGDRWVLRFRDDCRAFDPLHYVPAEGENALGLRLMRALADEANYTYSLNLNNLTLKLSGEQTVPDGVPH